jgi:hypothetical protein
MQEKRKKKKKKKEKAENGWEWGDKPISLEEPLAPSRGPERHKGWSRVTSEHLKAGQVVEPRAELVEQKAVFKTELPHFVGREAGQTDFQLKGNMAAA